MSDTNCDDFNVPKAQPIVELKLFQNMFAKNTEQKCSGYINCSYDTKRIERVSSERDLKNVSSLSTVLSGEPRSNESGWTTGMDGH